MERSVEINNEIYNELGERWYNAYDNPIALLRAESLLTSQWIQEIVEIERIQKHTGAQSCKILDIGCGGGFLSNRLAREGYSVTGIDLSEESLAVARKYDSTGRVFYCQGEASHLPFNDGEFDFVSTMDFLEHVENPARVIQEVQRVLRPQGIFFFHTFNRNPISGLVIIKFVEWFVKNTPKNLHLLRMFIKPKEMIEYCSRFGLEVQEMKGTRPNLWNWSVLKAVSRGSVPKDFSFSFTKSLMLSYVGYATKAV